MGKLAERLADARRSGVYRVVSLEALEEAVGLNGFSLHRYAVDAGGAPRVEALREGRVLLFRDFEALVASAPGALEALLRELEVQAAACRDSGQRAFAVFLDASGLLPLPPLYHWKR